MSTELGMIFVMGPSGAGKSRFVNLLRGGSVREGAGLHSETKKCQMVPVECGSERSYVVDTPGFNDTTRTDAEVLAVIAGFLVAQHAVGFRLKGIVWLHPINEVRVRGADQDSLVLFQELCGKAVLKNVILATTRWDIVEDPILGAKRQRQLRRDFWKDMIAHGSVVQQFDGTSGTAQALVRRLLRRETVILQIQKDILKQGKPLEQTSAGRIVVPRVDARLKEKKKRIQALEKEISEAMDRNDAQSQRSLNERREQAVREHERIAASRDRLRVNLGREVAEKIATEKGRSKGKRDIGSIFAAVLGLTVTTVTNIILPLAGVGL